MNPLDGTVDNFLVGSDVSGRLTAMTSLRCTVVDARSPTPGCDLEVHFQSGTRAAAVSEAVLQTAGRAPGTPRRLDGQPLAADLPLGHPPLVDGAVLVALPVEPPPDRQA